LTTATAALTQLTHDFGLHLHCKGSLKRSSSYGSLKGLGGTRRRRSSLAKLDPRSLTLGAQGLSSPSVVSAAKVVSTATAGLGESVLFQKAGITPEYFQNADNMASWNRLAQLLSTKLDIEVDSPRIQHYYLPVYLWIKQKLRDHQQQNKNNKGSPGPLCVGLSAPQGCGKTTLVTAFEELFSFEEMTCVSMSLDDFYLTRADQVELAETNPRNELLQVRGNAGTHDIAMAMDLVQQVKNVSSDEIKVPSYDKTAFEGKGDRHKEDQWRTYNPSQVDVVLYEGWMQGFTAIEDEEQLRELEKNAGSGGITEVNAFLKEKDYDKMWKLMDAWLVIQVKELDCIYNWRLQAEHGMKKEFGEDKGMSDEEVKAFVDKYIPAYKTYLPGLYDEANHEKNLGCKTNDDVFMFEVDAKRSPVP
jgi:D-glycerate 3-kinase